jgi:lipopolysaccharide/colanic/teichoic acid biosynthesis glycosyltransferase
MPKRLADFILALFCLFVFAVPLLIVALLVRCNLGSPVFFRQQRAGLHGRSFNLWKFRSMVPEDKLAPMEAADDKRLTAFGRFLRASSLDELPELWNVLRGEMSLVGPRPLLPEYLPLYTPTQARRHEVRPGITGWAQVNGRNAISWEEKFRLDVWYVDNRSFWLDLKILWLTVLRVFQRHGINAEGEATMQKFTGSSVAKKSS